MSEPVRYFAFGANMASRVLVKRRGIVPLASEAAVVRGRALRFCLRGLPGLEPAFASLVPAEGEEVHGVLHLLAPADMARLDRIEAGYDRVAVTAQVAAGEVAASAYVARRPAPEKLPSRRYLALLVEGAREHGLPEAYVAALEARRGHHVPLVSDALASLLEVGDRLVGRLRR